MKQKFPGFKACMAMMRKRDAATQEDGFFWLKPRAGEFVPELLKEYRSETDIGLRCWLLELLAEPRAPETLDVFVEALHDGELNIQHRALVCIRTLNTPEARQVLWNAAS
jgi:hypothetical protein